MKKLKRTGAQRIIFGKKRVKIGLWQFQLVTLPPDMFGYVFPFHITLLDYMESPREPRDLPVTPIIPKEG
jgi:hypothetical protein